MEFGLIVIEKLILKNVNEIRMLEKITSLEAIFI
jgi:hypothetical protein